MDLVNFPVPHPNKGVSDRQSWPIKTDIWGWPPRRVYDCWRKLHRKSSRLFGGKYSADKLHSNLIKTNIRAAELPETRCFNEYRQFERQPKFIIYHLYEQVSIRKAGTKEVALPHTIEHLYLGDNVFDDDEEVWQDDIPEVKIKFNRNSATSECSRIRLVFWTNSWIGIGWLRNEFDKS